MGYLKNIKCPIFNAEGLKPKDLPPIEEYFIEIGGNTDKAGKYLLKDFLSNFEKRVVNCRLTSVSRFSVRANWGGVLWSDFMKWVGDVTYKYVYFESYGKYATVVEKEDMSNERILICNEVEGEPLEFAYGGPIRMVIPNLWGYKSCKWLKRIFFIDEYIVGFWESRGYDDRGLIEPCVLLDVNTGNFKKIKGGEVLEF
ncbi:molybdopterin-dependent oxidoreductase [Calditerrivibrio nitroreducens]|uniref:Oxidoreductase molybdopterin binding protein n=1 Tax=Calditerrivibrio nitroreducens (strain DSM 19672 / NBRC 101217 / Yu37-1) TaxID=768670 RepID=E4TJQ6_CALNY|nr:molybdopterin-dependent oxidoreductase [Calditerrivibrio nitroreducens]ADR19252.1 oxidoreductase molybdopterin binding protein [Calditerrivibrio nitroreducens DSM 19672]